MDYVNVQTRYRLIADYRSSVAGAGVKGQVQQGNAAALTVGAGGVALVKLDAAGNPIPGDFTILTGPAFDAGFEPAPEPAPA